MATDRPRNVAASVRQRLLNHSTVIKADPNLVLIWYGLERLLYRFMSRRFDFDGSLLAAAIRATFERRATALSETVPVGLTSAFAEDSSHVRQWTAFLRRVGGEKPPALMDVIEVVGEFVLPPARAAIGSRAFPRRWTPQSAWH
jgi:hypothetical protein